MYAKAKKAGTDRRDSYQSQPALRASDPSNFGNRRGGTGGCRPSLAVAHKPIGRQRAHPVNTLLVAFDLGGTFVFALSGATAGVKHRLDLFGVLVLSFAAGNSGGIARDVMIGADSSRGHQRLAISRCFHPCRADYVLSGIQSLTG